MMVRALRGAAVLVLMALVGCESSPSDPAAGVEESAPGVYEIVSMGGAPLPYFRDPIGSIQVRVTSGWVRLNTPLLGTGRRSYCEWVEEPPLPSHRRTSGIDVRWWVLPDGRVAMRGTQGVNPPVDTLHIQGDWVTVRTGDNTPGYEMRKVSDDASHPTPACEPVE